MTTPDLLTAELALAILKQHGQATEHYMKQALTRQPQAPARLIESIDYSLMAGGKRLRPTLVLESCVAVSGKQTPCALATAAAIELIHTFSLVHDDLPAMDNDDLRRGRPTNHKVFGEAMAILAGDGMVTLAFELIARDAKPTIVPSLIAELAHATGPQGMIGGQVLDMDGEQKSLNFDQLKQLHAMKTGALLTSACRLGAIAAGASSQQFEALTQFGRHLGLAFQIIDDVLDVTSTPEQMGKATNKDAGKGKNTYPSLLGLSQSQDEARNQLEAALSAIAPFGEQAKGLAALAKFVVQRQS